ncbi:DUF6127 family protein [Parablastomonas sp. CN1-191]|uniref:DUF6127 family protein n=1 Tax=Parablastomonas sp. CN1-191 TaxID=3400908 RepID=UPI003BF89C4E
MNSDDVLARLLAQAADSGGDFVTLRAIVEEASEIGAERALHRLGLADPGAEADQNELRELLAAWRDAKRSAWRAAIAWIARGVFALLLAGMAYRLGVTGLLK